MRNAMLVLNADGSMSIREGTDAEHLAGMLEWYEFDAKCKAEYAIRRISMNVPEFKVIEKVMEQQTVISKMFESFRRIVG